MTKILDATLEAMKEGLALAATHMLQGERALDADSYESSELPVDERHRLLDDLRRRYGLNAAFTEDEKKRHDGLPPIPADRLTHLRMSEVIRKHIPIAFITGEEASDLEWDLAEEAPIGAIIFNLDAIDGSQPYDTLTFGYSSNVTVHIRREGEDYLLLSGVANSSGFVAIYEAGNLPGDDSVSAGTLDDALEPLSEPMVSDIREGTIAVLGAPPRHRESIRAVIDDENLTVFTTGGAPPSLGLIIGRLAALASTESQAMHDATYLPIAAWLGIPIVTAGNITLGLREVRSFFKHVRRDDKRKIPKTVPPFVIARNPQFGFEIAKALDLGSRSTD
jgi:hypothetical protein